LLANQDFFAALPEARALNREWPDDVGSYQLLAAAQLGLGDYDDSEKSLQWMLDLRIGKTDSEGWMLVARFREATGDIEGATEAVNTAYRELAPGQGGATVLAYLAQLQLSANRVELADRALSAQAGTPSSEPVVLETLARIRLAQGRQREGIAILRELAIRTAQPRHLYLVAQATRNRSDFATFERAARERTAASDNANRELALYYSGPGRRALEALRIARLESERRHDVLTLDALAVALFANGRAREAAETMKRVLAIGIRDPEIMKHAGRIGVKPE
jgi:predicted Zn-dependent protease